MSKKKKESTNTIIYKSKKPLSIIFSHDIIRRIVESISEINAEVAIELNYKSKQFNIYTTLSDNVTKENDLYLFLNVIDVIYNINDDILYNENMHINFTITSNNLVNVIAGFTKFDFIEMSVYNNNNTLEFYSEIETAITVNKISKTAITSKIMTYPKSVSDIPYMFNVEPYKNVDSYIYLGLIDIKILNIFAKDVLNKYKKSNIKITITSDYVKLICGINNIETSISTPNLLNTKLDDTSKHIKTINMHKIKNFAKVSSNVELRISYDKHKNSYTLIVYPILFDLCFNKFEIFYIIKMDDRFLK